MTDIIRRRTPIRVHVVLVHGRAGPGIRTAQRIAEEEAESLSEASFQTQLHLVDLDDVAVIREDHPRTGCDQWKWAGCASHSSVDVACAGEAQTEHVHVIGGQGEIRRNLPLDAYCRLLSVRMFCGAAWQIERGAAFLR